MHAISKIIARHADRTGVEVGEIVNVVPDSSSSRKKATPFLAL